TGNASTSYTVTVDTTAPNAPVISTVTDNVAPVTGTVANYGSSNDTTLQLRSEERRVGKETISDGASQPGTAAASAGGAWSFTTWTLRETRHSVTTTAVCAADNTGNASTSYTVTVDTTAPNAPVISTVADNVAPVTGTVANYCSSNDTTLQL